MGKQGPDNQAPGLYWPDQLRDVPVAHPRDWCRSSRFVAASGPPGISGHDRSRVNLLVCDRETVFTTQVTIRADGPCGRGRHSDGVVMDGLDAGAFTTTSLGRNIMPLRSFGGQQGNPGKRGLMRALEMTAVAPCGVAILKRKTV